MYLGHAKDSKVSYRMKVTLIRPARVFKKYNKALKPSPPLGLAIIASVLEENGHHVHVVDAAVEGIDDIHQFEDDIYINGLSIEQTLSKISNDTELIGFSCMFTVDWIYLKDLINAASYLFPNATIIAGGEHVTALPELCLEDCAALRACVMGEGEETIVELLYALQENKDLGQVDGIAYKSTDNVIVRTNKRKRLRELDKIPPPSWHLFPVRDYLEKKINFGVGNKRTLPILATRGCPYTCTFCSSPDMWGTRYFLRSPTNVVDEIELLVNKYNVENIDLYDLTAIISAKWTIDFCNEIIKRNLKISWQLPSGTRSEAITKDVVLHMKKSGCSVITYAPESGSPRVLKSIRKKVNLGKMLMSISNSNKAGLFAKVNIIIGLPMETHTDIFRTMIFILRCSWYGAYDMGPNPFYPIPGTALFYQLQKEKKVDITDKKYFIDLLDADNLSKGKFYNDHIPQWILRIYFIIYILLFYSSNFLIHPSRIVTTFFSIVKMKPQTRGQYVLVRIIEQTSLYKMLRRKPKPTLSNYP